MKSIAVFYRCSLPNHPIHETRASKSTKRLTRYLLTLVLLSCSAQLRSQPLPAEYLAAEQALNAGKFKTADSLLLRLIKSKPPLPRAYQRFAESYIDRDSVPEGIRRFENFLNVRPGDANAHAGLAMLYNSTGNADSALAYGLLAVRGGAPIIPACEITVHIARAQKQDDLLNAQLQARLNEKPNDLAAGYTQIYVAYADGRLKEASAQLDALQKHYPRDWRLFHLRSLVEVEYLSVDEVLSSIQKGFFYAKSANDKEGIAYMLYRQVCTHLARVDSARASRAIQKLKDTKVVSQRLDILKILADAMYNQAIGKTDTAIMTYIQLRDQAIRRRDCFTEYVAGFTLGKAYLQLANFGAAEHSILLAKIISDSLHFTIRQLAEELRLGFAREWLGFYDFAAMHYRAVEKHSENIGALQHLLHAWSGLARISMHYHKPDEAIAYRKKQLALSRTLGRWEMEMDALIELGRIYMHKNEDDSVSQALQMTSTLLHTYKTPRDIFNFRLLQGDFAKKTGDYAQARKAYELAFAVANDINTQTVVAVHMKLGDLWLKCEKYDRAVDAYQRAYDAVLQRVADKGLEKGQLDLATSREAIISLIKGLVYRGEKQEAFEKARQSRLLVLRALEVVQDRTRLGGGGKALALMKQINAARTELAKLTENGEATEAQLFDIKNKIDLLRLQLGNLTVQNSSAKDTLWLDHFLNNPDSLAELQKSLSDQKAVVLVYLVGNNCVVAFALHPDTLLASIIPAFHRNSLRTLVKRLNDLLSFDKNIPLSEELKSRLQFDLDHEAARALVETLINPLLMNRRPEKLIIMPDDVLCVLPFDALMLAADTSGIGLEKLPRIQISLDLRDIVAQEPIDSANALIMANGQPVKMGIEGRTFPPLQFVVSEAKRIARLLSANSCDLLCNEDASRENFWTNAEGYDVLHLAVHANLSDWSAEYAQLYFGSANGNSEPIYGYEISQLNLRARLAVLSACNTALGHYRPGFGLLSFVLNFMDAGVPSVVASLWQVDTKTTEILMVEFYEHLYKGKSYSEALALAKQHLIEEGYSDPYYWAGFVLFGRDGTVKFLESSPKSPKSAWWILIALIVVFLWVWRRYQKGMQAIVRR